MGTVEPGYSVPTVEPWSTRFELVPTVAVPLPEPLAEKYAQPPIAARAATSTTARTAIVFVVTNFMYVPPSFEVGGPRSIDPQCDLRFRRWEALQAQLRRSRARSHAPFGDPAIPQPGDSGACSAGAAAWPSLTLGIGSAFEVRVPGSRDSSQHEPPAGVPTP